MARFRTFEAQPSRALAWAGWGWVGGLAAFCVGNAWMPWPWPVMLGQGWWMLGLFLAMVHVLVAVAARKIGVLGRGLVIGLAGFLTLGPQETAPTLGAAVRLFWDRAEYREAMTAYELTGRAQCDCLVTERGADRLTVFRWRRGNGLWDGIAHDPGGLVPSVFRQGASDDGQTPRGEALLGGPVVTARPVVGPWVYLVVARSGATGESADPKGQ